MREDADLAVDKVDIDDGWLSCAEHLLSTTEALKRHLYQKLRQKREKLVISFREWCVSL